MNCSVHEDVIADWECMGCGKWCCPSCVKVIETRTVDLETCRGCGSMVRRVMSSIEAPDEDLRALAMRAFTPEGAITSAGIALPALIAGAVFPFWVFYFAMLSTYYLQVVDHVGHGRPGMPHFGDSANLQAGFGGSIGRGIAVAVIVFAPYILWRFGWVGIDNESSWIVDGLTVALGLTYAPAAILAMVLAGTALAGAWIPAWFHVFNTDRRGYLELTGQFFAAFAVWLVVHLTLSYLLSWLPFLGSYVATAISTLFWFVQAVWIGAWMKDHHEDFEFKLDVGGDPRMAATSAMATRGRTMEPGPSDASPMAPPPMETALMGSAAEPEKIESIELSGGDS